MLLPDPSPRTRTRWLILPFPLVIGLTLLALSMWPAAAEHNPQIVDLAPGGNLIAYDGATLPVRTALGDAEIYVDAIWAFAADDQSWTLWSPTLPEALQGFTELEPGRPYFMIASQPVTWEFRDSDLLASTACEGDERLTLEYPPVDLGAIEFVVPLGLMSDSHVTPVDHQYFQNYRDPERVIAVYSPAAGTVTEIQHMNQAISDRPSAPIDDFRLVTEHACGLSSIFIHIGQLSPASAAFAPPPGAFAGVDVTVQAGEQIGTFQRNVDYNVVDDAVTLEGLLVPEHYEAEPWKIHAPNSFDYFSDAIREQLIAKSLRTAEPVGGRFDYDSDGRLVGNWFQEGTNGYAGADRARYWAGHLAIAYDHLDTSLVVVSIGTFDGAAAQFAVGGNAPDPAEVSVASGLVTYELVPYDYWVGDTRWDRVSLVRGIEARGIDASVQGVVLFEMLKPRTLQVEVFPGQTASSVDGFTTAALLYER